MEDEVSAMEARGSKAVMLDCRRWISIVWYAAILVGSGCATSETLSSYVSTVPSSGPASSMAVIAELRTVEQNGQSIDGLVVQMLLSDADGKPCGSDGSVVFSVYREDTSGPRQVQADRQWRFSPDEVRRSQAVVPLGVLHNFWLPLNGRLRGVKKAELFTVYQGANGVSLTQRNRVTAGAKEMHIETRNDIAQLRESVESSQRQ